MTFFSRFFAFRKAPPPDSAVHSHASSGNSRNARVPAMSPDMRRELLRVTLRETLRRHGIPLAWIGADMLTATSRTGQTGIHWRLSIRHWDPRLMTYVVALQNRLISRLQMVDPMAETWLMGVSWQVAVPDESACPALPHPGSWTAPATHSPTGRREGPASGGSADVIAGPVRIEEGAGAVKSDLDRLMAARDADFLANNAPAPGADGATEPMYLKTEPAKP